MIKIDIDNRKIKKWISLLYWP